MGAAYFPKEAAKLARGRRSLRRPQSYVHGGRFLDAGCNGGFVVEAAREAGFKAVGVELDAAAVAWPREHYPANTYFVEALESFAEVSDHVEAFDVLYCSEMIEHAPDANRFAASLASLLRPRGVLYLTTPDVSHWRRPRDLAQCDAYTPPEHCLYFTSLSLARLLDRHGLGGARRRIAWKPGIKVLARKIAT